MLYLKCKISSPAVLIKILKVKEVRSNEKKDNLKYFPNSSQKKKISALIPLTEKLEVTITRSQRKQKPVVKKIRSQKKEALYNPNRSTKTVRCISYKRRTPE